MNFKELNSFLTNQEKILKKSFPIPDKEKAIFARMMKISEEVGELNEAILSFSSLQRKDKKERNKEKISEEIADVLITTMLLAVQFDVNIEKSLENKIKNIKKRKY